MQTVLSMIFALNKVTILSESHLSTKSSSITNATYISYVFAWCGQTFPIRRLIRALSCASILSSTGDSQRIYGSISKAAIKQSVYILAVSSLAN